ncbi:hypothetical protein Bca52824_069823, partial [Brassica carinata]
FHTSLSDINTVLIHKETLDMLASLGMSDMPGVFKVDPISAAYTAAFGSGRSF